MTERREIIHRGWYFLEETPSQVSMKAIQKYSTNWPWPWGKYHITETVAGALVKVLYARDDNAARKAAQSLYDMRSGNLKLLAIPETTREVLF